MHIYRNKCTGSLEITTVMSKGHSIESHLDKVHFYPVSRKLSGPVQGQIDGVLKVPRLASN